MTNYLNSSRFLKRKYPSLAKFYIRNVRRFPSAVVSISNIFAIREATNLGLPVAFLADSSSDVTFGSYGIPGNEAFQSYKVLVDLSVAACKQGVRERKISFGRFLFEKTIRAINPRFHRNPKSRLVRFLKGTSAYFGRYLSHKLNTIKFTSKPRYVKYDEAKAFYNKFIRFVPGLVLYRRSAVLKQLRTKHKKVALGKAKILQLWRSVAFGLIPRHYYVNTKTRLNGYFNHYRTLFSRYIFSFQSKNYLRSASFKDELFIFFRNKFAKPLFFNPKFKLYVFLCLFNSKALKIRIQAYKKSSFGYKNTLHSYIFPILTSMSEDTQLNPENSNFSILYADKFSRKAPSKVKIWIEAFASKFALLFDYIFSRYKRTGNLSWNIFSRHKIVKKKKKLFYTVFRRRGGFLDAIWSIVRFRFCFFNPLFYTKPIKISSVFSQKPQLSLMLPTGNFDFYKSFLFSKNKKLIKKVTSRKLTVKSKIYKYFMSRLPPKKKLLFVPVLKKPSETGTQKDRTQPKSDKKNRKNNKKSARSENVSQSSNIRVDLNSSDKKDVSQKRPSNYSKKKYNQNRSSSKETAV